MLLVFRAVIFGGLDQSLGGPGDSRFVNYALEHGYRWLMRDPLHLDFWSPPVFFPLENTAAFTDVLLGAGPLYWIWRWVGLVPDTSFQLWTMMCWSLNYVAMLVLLRRYLGIGVMAAMLASVIYAFGSARLAYVGHPQLALHVWVLVSLMAAMEWFGARHGSASRGRQAAALLVFVAALSLQAWTAMYMFMFAVMSYVLCGLWALALRSYRRPLLRLLGEHWRILLVGLGLGFALLWPLVSRYLQVGEELGRRPFRIERLPDLSSWLLMGRANLMYGWLQRGDAWFAGSSSLDNNGSGLLCLSLCLAGLWRGRRRPLVALLILSTVSMLLLTLRWPSGISAWSVVREIVPGATGLRALPRVAMLALIPAAVGLALFFQRPFRSKRPVLVGMLMLICVAEQAHGKRSSYDKHAMAAYVESIAARIPSDCEAFFLVSRGEGPEDNLIHDDAEWAALLVGIPTINGRYGRRPIGYMPLRMPNAADVETLDALKAAMDDWLRAHGRDPSLSALVEVPAGARPTTQ